VELDDQKIGMTPVTVARTLSISARSAGALVP
jgi:hypothetical protein